VSRRHEPAPSGPVRPGADRGLLIHAAVGRGGGTGTPRSSRGRFIWNARTENTQDQPHEANGLKVQTCAVSVLPARPVRWAAQREKA
jgi:hypothetical protein